LVYFNYDGVVFLKDIKQNEDIIKKYKIDLANWKSDELDLMKLGPVSVKPYRNYYIAFTLESMGFHNLALKELNLTLKILPNYAEAHKLLGKIYAAKKDYKKSFEHFRIASSLAPHNKKLRFNLALSYKDNKNYDGAIKQYQSIINVWPNEPEGYIHLAEVYALNENFDKTLETMKIAQQKNTEIVRNILEIGDIVFEKKEYQIAKDIYMVADKSINKNGNIYLKIGNAYKALGNLEAAKIQWKKGLSIDPDHEELTKSINEIE